MSHLIGMQIHSCMSLETRRQLHVSVCSSVDVCSKYEHLKQHFHFCFEFTGKSLPIEPL